MDTIKKGNITEIKVQLELVKLGYHVFTPITDGCSTDLIVVGDGGEAKKIQVKTCKKVGTGFSFDIRKSTSSSRVRKKKYTESEVDFFATIHDDKLYLIPIKAVENYGSAVTLRTENKTDQHDCLLAVDYEINKMMKAINIVAINRVDEDIIYRWQGYA